MEIDFEPSGLDSMEDITILKEDSKNNIYISVIVPCYNVERYIDRCVNSIINQTIGIEHLQIILVNDASSDGTLLKLQQWRERFPKEIIVISYKENLRQGGARNLGMQCADGEYIGFVDSDDWVELDMYEKLYEKAVENNVDVVRGKFIRERFKGQIQVVNDECKEYCYEFEKRNGWYVNHIVNSGVNGEFGGVWSAIYKKEVIIKNGVWFPEKIAYEDNYWGAVLNLYVRNMCIVDRIVYHYFVNTNSTVTQKNAVHQLDRLNIEVMKVEKYKSIGAFETIYDEIEWDFIKMFYLNTLYIVFKRFDFMPDIYGFMRHKIYLYFPNFMKNPRISECNEREKLLLSLLEIPRDLSVEEMLRIKTAYLKTF